METLWGLLVIVCALAVIAPVVWWAFKQDEQELAEEEGVSETQVIRLPDISEDLQTAVLSLSVEETQIIEPLIVDLRMIEPRAAVVIDELGEWVPEDHAQEQPLLLVQVLLSGEWGSLNPRELGMVAA